MFFSNRMDGSASISAVLALGAFMGVALLHEKKVTQHAQTQVLSANLTNLAKEANESALTRTRSLLTKGNGGEPSIKVVGVGAFQKISGTGFELVQGNINLSSPLPSRDGWLPSSGAAGNLNSRLKTSVKVEEIIADGAGVPAFVVVSATTTTEQADISKTIKTKARFDLVAINASVPPASSVPAPPVAPAPPVVVASNSTVSSAPTPTGCTPPAGNTNVGNMGNGVGIGNTGNSTGIGNVGGGTGIANQGSGIGIANTTGGIGIGNSNGGVGIGNNGGIGIGSQCGGIGINAPAGCIGIGFGGNSCLGVRTTP